MTNPANQSLQPPTLPSRQALPRRIYLDNAATTPVSEAALTAMLPYFQESFGNPSAIYSYGLEANQALSASRRLVASCLGAMSSEIFFTSGGTESDNWAIHSVVGRSDLKGRHIITSAIEHNAVLKPLAKLAERGFEITLLPPDRAGRIAVAALERARRPDTILVSIMLANNVVGTVQDIPALARAAHEVNAVFHVDAVQAAGYLPIDVRALGVDLLSISGHKFHGPKGVGALYARIPRLPEPLLNGGGQERGGRSGTENVPGVVGLATALAEAVAGLPKTAALTALRDQLIEGVLRIPGAFLTGDPVNRLPGLASFVFTGLKSSVHLINRLNERGVCASSGSACSVASQEASQVLMAMGFSEELARCSLRLSLSRRNTAEEVETVVALLPELIADIRAKIH
ncbi:MAG: cysteine desulfurase [Deltaproteobacteria bacterium]|jgi:cysteine desulfurase|nr:cysteine desulfurase [Deltaproteobacteria bacterium]